MPRAAKHALQPAKDIIDFFGGCRATGRILGINPSTVSRWMTAKEEEGTGGRIPQKYWEHIIGHAKNRGRVFTTDELAGLPK